MAGENWETGHARRARPWVNVSESANLQISRQIGIFEFEFLSLVPVFVLSGRFPGRHFEPLKTPTKTAIALQKKAIPFFGGKPI
jgi:hypothetical protein